MAGAKLDAGVIHYAGANNPGWVSNIAFLNATTTNANDSVKICSADGTALSVHNPGWITLPSTSAPGQMVRFQVTANVTINLTGAHWGLGTTGDYTNYMLSGYAINDAGVLKWGVASVPGHSIILNADDTATATAVTTVEKVLVNSLLGADATCREVGWVKANFDDTMGAAEDLWAVQTAVTSIFQGPRPSIPQAFKPTGTWIANSTYTGLWCRKGQNCEVWTKVETAGAPTMATLTFNLPSGLVVDTAAILRMTGDTSYSHLGKGIAIETGVVAVDVNVHYSSTTAVQPRFANDGAAGVDIGGGITEAAPVTFLATDGVQARYEVPIVGWS